MMIRTDASIWRFYNWNFCILKEINSELSSMQLFDLLNFNNLDR